MAQKSEDSQRPRWSSTTDPWLAPVQHAPGAFPTSPYLKSPAMSSSALEAQPSITEVVRARKDEYIRTKKIKVKIGTWNVAAFPGTLKDLRGWFAEGLGVKDLTRNTSGPSTESHSSESPDTSDSEIESIDDQEKRFRKKSSTLPENDVSAVAAGEEVDLYVLGLQEVVDISSMTEAVRPYTDPKPSRRWKRAIRKALPPGYTKVASEQLLGLLLLVFASPQLNPEITSVDTTSVGTGLLGYLGNKGAVSARILLGETTRMLFVNCHLAAGADSTALSRRIWDTGQILTRTQFSPVGEECVHGSGNPEHIGDEDIAFWFGDLNYRLDDIPGEDVRRLLLLHVRNEYDVSNKSRQKMDSELESNEEEASNQSHNKHDSVHHAAHLTTGKVADPSLDPANDPASLLTTVKSLLTHDQLHRQQRQEKAFHEGWQEGDINFLPTYKYDVGSVAMFDSGEKQRSPSWCDRILYRTRLQHEEWKMRTKTATLAKKKDEDMKKRGLDEAANQEHVLFDYDPDTDGGDRLNDDDEYDENEHDMELTRTKSALEEAVIVKEYVSHQRVLSSDHKPLTAVFDVIYNSVDQGLKSRIHEEVTRQFDKVENESKPSVTLVLDHASHLNSTADTSLASPELNMVDFGQVRYAVMYEHHLTIANTGRIEVTYAFVDRLIQNNQQQPVGPFPPWLTVVVNHEIDKTKTKLSSLGNNTRYKLSPGETTAIDLSLDITEAEMVSKLNMGEIALDDVLVLRIDGGRDCFVPVRGIWLQSCFFRSVDELVRVPSGVRSLTLKIGEAVAQLRPTTAAVHSAPQELFALTEGISNMAERVIADWEMLHDDEEPPWKIIDDHPWPFDLKDEIDTDADVKEERLAEVREALDTAESLDEHMSPCIETREKLEVVAEVFLAFLASLTDGIITSTVWQMIESQLVTYEKSKTSLNSEQIQDIAMEAISSTPVHSVSLTFITFMLKRIMTEIYTHSLDRSAAPQTSKTHARSSSSASAMSNISLSSVSSNRTRRSFFPSLSRRANDSTSATSLTNSISPELDASEQQRLAYRFARLLAPLIIKSKDDPKMWAKEKKAQLARKVKVLEAFLDQPL